MTDKEKMGTLRVPNAVPSADQDCQRLKKAFDGVSPTRCVCGSECHDVLLMLFHSRAVLFLASICVFIYVIMRVYSFIAVIRDDWD